MKKIISLLILVSFLLINIGTANSETLPELPNLPTEPEFDTVIPPDNLDVFAPSETPAQTVSKPVVQTAKPTKPESPTVTQSSTIKVTPVNNTTKSTQTSQTAAQKTVNTNPPPKQVPNTTQTKTVSQKPVNTANNSYYKNNLKNAIVLPKGKKFKVQLAQSVSSNSPVGTNVKFTSLYPETTTYVTIPAGTSFYGKITNSHKPQITGNGGLIEIDVTRMTYKGRTYQIDAKVSVANGKRIFFNNIKGQRMYLRSIPKTMQPGSKFFGKMWKVTKKLAKNESGVEIILTPFSLLTGTVVYAVNAVSSPVLAIFYKGKSITIPANSKFTIQLQEDVSLIK